MSDHSKQLIESVAKGNDAFAMVKSVVAEIEASEAPIDLTDEFPEDKLGKDWVFGEEPMDIEVDYLRYHPEWRRFKSSGSQGDRRVVARFHISADGEEYDDDDEIVSVPRYKVFISWAAELDNPGLVAERAKNKAGDPMLVHDKTYSAKEFKSKLGIFKNVLRKLKEINGDVIAQLVTRA
jgi:hypothetical protein